MVEKPMNSTYVNALRRLRRLNPEESPSYKERLFPISWIYFEDSEVLEKKTRTSTLIENKPSEKDKVLESFQEFAQKQMNEKEGFRFPGGEAKKKESESAEAVFANCAGKTMSEEALKDMSLSHGEVFANLKFGQSPAAPLKILFVVDETQDLEKLDASLSSMEAFFEEPAARLFEKMTAAMGLRQGEAFVTSLNILKGGQCLSFEEGAAQEIYNLKPQIVAPLGGAASSAFLGEGLTLQNSHGRFFKKQIEGQEGPFAFEVMPLFSPAFLVEAPNTKRIAWEDMQKAMKKWEGPLE